MTDSSTGGFLQPAPPPAPTPKEGQDLNRFLQPWLAALSGLDPTLVRPMFQSEPPVIPDQATAWMAFRFTTRPADTYPWLGFDTEGEAYQLQRHEELHILCSFYDLGTNGLADYYAALTRDGTAVSQNNEILLQNLMAFAYCEDQVAVPSLVKERWLYRVDLPIVVRRQVVRTYPVETVESVVGELVTDTGIEVPLDIVNPNP